MWPIIIAVLSLLITVASAGLGLFHDDWFWFGIGGVAFIPILGLLASRYIEYSNEKGR